MSETREKILDSAERLFLARGYDSVSVRQITDEAGVNVASVNYHFKSKRNLYREFFHRKASTITSIKLKELNNVLDKPGKPDLKNLIRTYVSLFFEDILLSHEKQKFLEIILAEMSGNGMANDILVNEIVGPVHNIMKQAILRARPEISNKQASMYISSITAQVIHFIRARDIVSHTLNHKYDKKLIKDIAEHITDFSLRGIG